MKKQIVVIITYFSFNLLHLGAQNNDLTKHNIPFKQGEYLEFTINYSAAIIDLPIARMKLSIEDTKDNSCNIYKINVIGETNPFYNMFFEVNDTYTTWLDRRTLKTLKMVAYIKEGDDVSYKRYDFDWDKYLATTYVNNIISKKSLYDTLDITNYSYDVVGLFYNLRILSRELLQQEKIFRRDVVLDDTVRQVVLEYIKTENKDVGVLGVVEAMCFKGNLVTQSGDAINDGDEFYLWVSNDRNKIPLYVECPIRVGSVVVELEKWSGLKYPLECVSNW